MRVTCPEAERAGVEGAGTIRKARVAWETSGAGIATDGMRGQRDIFPNDGLSSMDLDRRWDEFVIHDSDDHLSIR